jgi:hypothetical protein
MSLDRNRLPEPQSYFEAEGLTLKGPGKWKTAACNFHGGSDSMRINTLSGGFKCMACGVGGGDVLAYHLQAHGLDFVEGAKALGAWVDDGRPRREHKPTTLPPRAAIELMSFEASLVAIAACNMAKGLALDDNDRQRLLQSAARVQLIASDFGEGQL